MHPRPLLVTVVQALHEVANSLTQHPQLLVSLLALLLIHQSLANRLYVLLQPTEHLFHVVCGEVLQEASENLLVVAALLDHLQHSVKEVPVGLLSEELLPKDDDEKVLGVLCSFKVLPDIWVGPQIVKALSLNQS